MLLMKGGLHVELARAWVVHGVQGPNRSLHFSWHCLWHVSTTPKAPHKATAAGFAAACYGLTLHPHRLGQ
jgi:hypothetical protein